VNQRYAFSYIQRVTFFSNLFLGFKVGLKLEIKMFCLVVIYDECLSYNCVSNLFYDVLRHETLTFLELFFMYKSSMHITCLIKYLSQLFEPFFCSLHLKLLV
jgi:hypothetical protein